jgi:hypothetical protein
LAKGEGSGERKYPKTASKTAIMIITNPTMAPLFFFSLRQEACQKEGDGFIGQIYIAGASPY